MKDRRIELLDSFRFLAITSVMLFHYAYNWAPSNFYPYGNFFKNTFEYANRGVQFFFIISGFVISYSLEKTYNLSAFFKNRLIRLLPPMILWSVVIYLTCILLDNTLLFPASHWLPNFLPSLTFTSPEVWSMVFHKANLDWLDPSFWTLWVEVQFYFVAGFVFFMNKEKFLRNILLVSLVLILVSYIPTHFSQPGTFNRLSQRSVFIISSWLQIERIFSLSLYICYFALGVVFHHLYIRKPIKPLSFTGISIAVVFCYQLYACVLNPVRIIYLVMVSLFLLMIFKKEWLRFLETPLIRRIGAISYSVYLSHQVIGVLLINKYGGYLGKWSPLAVPAVMILIIGIAEISYRFVEQRMGRFLKTRLFKPKPSLV